MEILLFLFLTLPAQAATYQCELGAEKGVKALRFDLLEGAVATLVAYELNSGIENSELCRVQRLKDSTALFCRGPSRLKAKVATQILVEKSAVSVEFYDLEEDSLPNFGSGARPENCSQH